MTGSSVSSSLSAAARTKSKALANPPSSPPLSPSPPRISKGQTLFLCLGLAAAVAAFYCPVVRNDFIRYDDGQYIFDNPHVNQGLKWDTIAWAFTTYEQANWHPLTWISHAFDCQLFGLNPVWHHVVNMLLHAINAVLLFLLLQYATGFRWRSLMVAALFALHPINVESVAWAAERKNVLSIMFFLLAVWAYVWYARSPGLRRYAWVVGLYALALMAKPQVITFPFLLWLLDYWPLGRIEDLWTVLAPTSQEQSLQKSAGSRRSAGMQLLWEKVPLLALSAVSAVVTVEAQSAGGALRDLAHYSLLLRMENAVVAYVRYLGKLFWPAKLVPMYPYPLRLYPAYQVTAALLLLLVITVLVVRARGQRYLAVGWFWFLGSLVPMVGLVQVGEQAMADRYAYLPFIGLFMMIVWGVADWAAGVGRKRQRIPARWLAAPALCWLLVLGALTARQVTTWHDTEGFWSRTLALTKGNYVAHENLANLLHEQGKDEEAIQHVRAVLQIRPQHVVGNLLLAEYEFSHGNVADAMARYRTVAERAENTVLRMRAYNELATAYLRMGDSAKAKQAFENSLQISPGQPEVMIQLGIIAQRAGDLKAAEREYSQAMAIHPYDVGYILLARTLQLEGRNDEAVAMLQRAASLTTNLGQSEKKAAAMLASH
jgi:protein O-mannosyl-transferase